MSTAAKLLVGYLTLVSAGVVVAVGCEPVDNQADAGSSIVQLGGNSSHIIDTKARYGKYKSMKPSETQKANCQWRVYAKVKGHWQQRSPTKAEAWNHLSSIAHRGSFRINEPSLVDTRNCPKWEMRK